MQSSFSIGRLFGIEVRVHLLFVYMAFFMTLFVGTPLTTFVTLIILFSLVLLHELGHSLVARHYGIQVLDIVLWPLGGMARMSEIPEDPKIEALVALAGPMVNIVFAFLGMVLLTLLGATGEMALIAESGVLHLVDYVRLFTGINLAMGAFNLLPAFPMDGGRILRAVLARKRDYLEATRLAVKVSQFLAFMMIFSIFIDTSYLMVALIGLYVLWTGMKELWSVRLRHSMAAGAGAFGTGGPFGPGAAGAVSLEALLRNLQQRQAQGGQATNESDPFTQEPPAQPGSGTGGGFSSEEIRRLEQNRGPLRKPSRDQD